VARSLLRDETGTSYTRALVSFKSFFKSHVLRVGSRSLIEEQLHPCWLMREVQVALPAILYGPELEVQVSEEMRQVPVTIRGLAVEERWDVGEKFTTNTYRAFIAVNPEMNGRRISIFH
jgi:hypothetical protein